MSRFQRVRIFSGLVLLKCVLMFSSLVLLATSVQAQHVKVVHFFQGFDGSGPALEVLAQGQDGNLYGTTLASTVGGGTVFRTTPSGDLDVLHVFAGFDGWHPVGGLVLASDGKFYGTTYSRGSYFPNGGTIFSIDGRGTLAVLDNMPQRLQNPIATMAEGDDGNLYGTTPGKAQFFTPGAVFRATRNGKLTLLYSFTGLNDGENPVSGLLLSDDGTFYGTTSNGGAGNCGTIFKISPDGAFSIVHTFVGLDGCKPFGQVVQADDGNYYGTTYAGGFSDFGTVYRLSRHGNLTVVHDFGLFDGAGPEGALVQATDGKIYGTTSSGAFFNFGTIFFVTTDGTFRNVFDFDGFHGLGPEGGLMQHTNGTLYGLATFGGINNQGTVFALDVGLGPFVKTVRPSGQVGTSVGILGQGFTGTTSVTFNGAIAKFFVQTDTYIVAQVPLGATNGFVQVDTPGGLLTSNTLFRVRP